MTLTSRILQNRANRIARHIIPHLQPGERVLDFGCGGFLVGAAIADEVDIDLVGVDVVDFNQTDLPLMLYEGNELPFENNAFDVLYAAFVFHHMTEIDALLDECIRVTRRRLLILEDVYNNALELLILKLLDQTNKLLASDMPLPLNFHSVPQWQAIFAAHGLTVQHVEAVRPAALRPTRHRMFVIEV